MITGREGVETVREGVGNRVSRRWKHGRKEVGTGREGDGNRERGAGNWERRGWEHGDAKGKVEG